MNTRVIHTKLWKDEFFADLTASEKVAFLYFITNERINVLHCYEVSNRELRFDTGLTDSQIQQAKEKFQQAGKMYFFKDWVFLKNACKYQKFEGETNDKAKEKIKETMGAEVSRWFTQVSDTNFEPIDTNNESIDTPQRGSNNQKLEIRNNSSSLVLSSSYKTELAEIKADELFLEELSIKYQVPPSFVLSKLDDLENWIEEKPSRARGRNLRRTLPAWVKKDAIQAKKGVQYGGKPTLTVIPGAS